MLHLKTYHIYYIQSSLKTYLNLDCSVTVCGYNLNNPVYFIPLDDKYGIITDNCNLNLFDMPYAYGNQFSLARWRNFALAHLVKYVFANSNFQLIDPFYGYYYGINLPKDDKTDYRVYLFYKSNQNTYFELFDTLSKPITWSLQKDVEKILSCHFSELNLLDLDKIAVDIMFQMMAISKFDPINILKNKYSEKWLIHLKTMYFNEGIVRYYDQYVAESRISELGPQHDFIGKYYTSFDIISPGQMPNYVMRNAVKPTKQICVVTTARNEGPYLLEFIAWYRALGIKDIFIYSNDNMDGSQELLEALAYNNLIYYIKNDVYSMSPQRKALAHAYLLNHSIQKFEYCINCDIDEFLFFSTEKYNTIYDFIKFHQTLNSDQIAINWVQMSSCGSFFYSPEPLLKRFTHGLPRRIIKSIFKPQKVGSINCHYPRPVFGRALNRVHANGTPFMCRDHIGDAQQYAYSDIIDISHAGFMHFAYKSLSEFIYKCGKQAADGDAITIDINFERINYDVLNEYIAHFDIKPNFVIPVAPELIENAYSELSRLLKINNIKTLHDKMKEMLNLSLKNYKNKFGFYLVKSPPHKKISNLLQVFLNKHNQPDFLDK